MTALRPAPDPREGFSRPATSFAGSWSRARPPRDPPPVSRGDRPPRGLSFLTGKPVCRRPNRRAILGPKRKLCASIWLRVPSSANSPATGLPSAPFGRPSDRNEKSSFWSDRPRSAARIVGGSYLVPPPGHRPPIKTQSFRFGPPDLPVVLLAARPSPRDPADRARFRPKRKFVVPIPTVIPVSGERPPCRRRLVRTAALQPPLRGSAPPPRGFAADATERGGDPDRPAIPPTDSSERDRP